MKRLLSLLFAMCLLLQLSAREFEIQTGVFSKLKIPDNLTVVYTCDPSANGVARFECVEHMADALMFANNGKGKLAVQISPDYIGADVELPVIYVSSEFLSEIESSSERTVTVKGLPRCEEFKATLFGNGMLNLPGLNAYKVTLASMTGHGTILADGQVADLLVKVAGTGNVDARSVKADKVSCHVFGGGEIHCTPIDELKLKGLGSTTVYYYGTPRNIKKHGVGKLIKADK